MTDDVLALGGGFTGVISVYTLYTLYILCFSIHQIVCKLFSECINNLHYTFLSYSHFPFKMSL